MTREKVSTASNHTIKFTTPTGVAAGQTMTVTFPAGFNMSSIVFGDVDISWGTTTGLENNDTAAQALAANPAGATWGAAVAGQVLTITSGTSTIPATNKVIIEIGTNATYGGTGTHQITNHATPASYTLTLGGTFGDSGTMKIVVVTNEQVAMDGSIDPSLTFTISANSTAFGNLTTGSVTTAATGVQLTIGTNANSGYAITVQDQGNGTNGGLYNAGTASTILSTHATLAAGTEGYGIQAAVGLGTPTIDADYLYVGNEVGQLTVAAQNLATSATATSTNHRIDVTHKAAIHPTTEPGNYVDTITYIATALY